MGWKEAPVVSSEALPSPSWKQAPEEIMQSTDWSGMKDIVRQAGRVAAPAIFPTIGAVLGTPFGPAGNIAGGLGGVAINQILGITEPGFVEPAAQTLVPGGAKTIGAAKRLFPAFGTEARGAETLNRLAPQEINALLKRYQPPTSAKELFGRLEGTEASIATPTAKEAAEAELKNISQSLPGFRESYGGLSKQLKGTSGAMGSTTSLPLPQFQRLLHDVGQHIEAAQKAGGVEKHGYGSLYRALMQDLEKASLPGEAGQTLAQGRQAFKKEQVLKEIEQIARPFTKKGAGLEEQYNANKVINKLKDPTDRIGKSFISAFTPQEQKIILDRLGVLNTIPSLPPQAGQTFGSGKFWTQTAPALAAGGYAGATINPVLGAAIAGTPYGMRRMRDLSTAWETETGKALIKNLIQSNEGKLTPEFWSAIQAFVGSLPAQPSQRLNEITIEKRT